MVDQRLRMIHYPKHRKSPHKHIVRTRHPRYGVSSYFRGNGLQYRANQKPPENIIPDTEIRFLWGSTNKAFSQETWMTPEKFLSLVSAPSEDKIRYGSLDWFEQKYANGSEEMIAPYLSVNVANNQVLGHEGRHRAYWLLLKGVKSIPVTLYQKNSDEQYVRTSRRISVSELKPDEGVLAKKKSALSLVPKLR